jgi:hypothetical protein
MLHIKQINIKIQKVNFYFVTQDNDKEHNREYEM